MIACNYYCMCMSFVELFLLFFTTIVCYLGCTTTICYLSVPPLLLFCSRSGPVLDYLWHTMWRQCLQTLVSSSHLRLDNVLNFHTKWWFMIPYGIMGHHELWDTSNASYLVLSRTDQCDIIWRSLFVKCSYKLLYVHLHI